MSIRDAITKASKEVLADYLAPELVERLTDDIVQRTGVELTHAAEEFMGFDFARSTSARGRPANAPARKNNVQRRGRRSASEDAEPSNQADDGDYHGPSAASGNDESISEPQLI